MILNDPAFNPAFSADRQARIEAVLTELAAELDRIYLDNKDRLLAAVPPALTRGRKKIPLEDLPLEESDVASEEDAEPVSETDELEEDAPPEETELEQTDEKEPDDPLVDRLKKLAKLKPRKRSSVAKPRAKKPKQPKAGGRVSKNKVIPKSKAK
jgi:hypothetical protein